MNSPVRFLSAAILSLALLHSATAAPNGLAAVVNGRPITRSEVDDRIKIQLLKASQITDPAKRNATIAKLKSEALDSLIEQELVLDEYNRLAQGQPIKQQYVDADVKQYINEVFKGDEKKFHQELANFGMSLRKFREMREKMLTVQMMRSNATSGINFATPEEKEKFLTANRHLFREEDYVKFSSISIPKLSPNATPQEQRKLMEEIRARVSKGGDFAAEARTYSQDSKAEQGGSWGPPQTRQTTQLNPAFADIVFQLKEKTLSPIIEEQDTFYLFYVEARIPGKSKPKAEIDKELEQLTILEKKKAAYENYVANLKKKANIRKYMSAAPPQTTAEKSTAVAQKIPE